MNLKCGRAGATLSVFVAVALIALGCGQAQDQAKREKRAKDDRNEWWCRDHGIPEDECCMCLPPNVVKEKFKDKGDWCEEHDRAKSQCFKCDPSKKELFASKYRARYGEDPPPIGEEKSKKDEKKN